MWKCNEIDGFPWTWFTHAGFSTWYFLRFPESTHTHIYILYIYIYVYHISHSFRDFPYIFHGIPLWSHPMMIPWNRPSDPKAALCHCLVGELGPAQNQKAAKALRFPGGAHGSHGSHGSRRKKETTKKLVPLVNWSTFIKFNFDGQNFFRTLEQCSFSPGWYHGIMMGFYPNWGISPSSNK